MRAGYKRWLEAQGYGSNTIATQSSHASRVELAYGDLDEAFAGDRLGGILASLRYSSDDARRNLANPSRLNIGGDLYKALAGFRTAVGLYRRYLETESGVDAGRDAQPINAAVLPSSEVRERVGLERDLQRALRRNIEDLEPGLSIIDAGAERPVPSGYIDITARDQAGLPVVIELKAGTADRAAIGQILSYMGDLAEEEQGPVRGILVAHDFDGKAKAAARMVPGLCLRSYAIRFSIGDPLNPQGVGRLEPGPVDSSAPRG